VNVSPILRTSTFEEDSWMKNWFLQIIGILIIAAVAALVVNGARSGGVALVGNWPSRTSHNEGPVVPPSAQPGDPPFITLEDAVTMFQSKDVIFIDARSIDDYDFGHITGAINIPYDYLDDAGYAAIDSLDHSRAYVVYCSGSECEVSLNLGRYMADQGFPHIRLFFGGWSEWVDNNLPITGPEAEAGEDGR
jgi:rhodanese-related sulfurtransferase